MTSALRKQATRLRRRPILLFPGLIAIALALLTAPSAPAQRPLGIDVSVWQGNNVNWNSVATSGVMFAWCKATEGATGKDSTFATNIFKARNAGVLIGAYHYARPDNNLGIAGAVREASNYWHSVSNYLKADGAYLMPVIDIEAPGVTNLPYTRFLLSEWVNAWCTNLMARAAAHGLTINPVVYSYVSYSSTWLDSSLTNYPLWMAHYNGQNPQAGAPGSTAPWPTWNAWQYSSTGTVAGVSGNCDQNVFNGTSNQLLNTLVIGAPVPPLWLTQPSSRTGETGGTLALTAHVAGGLPRHAQWRFHGTNLPGATNLTLVLSNLTTAHAGPYTLVVTNPFAALTSAVATVTVNPPFTPVFADNFDTDTSANWTLNRSSTDNRAVFAWDYSALGIPSATHSSGTTKGLRFEANLSAGLANALNVSPTGLGFPTNSRLRFDAWLNANGPFPDGGTGSTEALTAGVATAGNRVQWNGTGSTADGVWFSFTGEGGVGDTSATQGDFAAWSGVTLLSTASGVYAAGTASNARGNGHPYYHNVFPYAQKPPVLQQTNYAQQTGGLAAGAAGFQWRDVIIHRQGSRVDWFIDGLRIATVTNASLTASNIFVGYWDPFTSVSDNTNLSFGLVDNLRVEVPAIAPLLTLQPASQWAALGGTAMFSAAATGLPAPTYQWRRNGTNIAGATNATLTLNSLAAADAALYSVVVSNVAGTQTSSNALLSLLAVNPPLLAPPAPPSGNTLTLSATLDAGATYTLETSTNFTSWSALTNFVAPAPAWNLTVPLNPADPWRYYRLRSGP